MRELVTMVTECLAGTTRIPHLPLIPQSGTSPHSKTFKTGLHREDVHSLGSSSALMTGTYPPSVVRSGVWWLAALVALMQVGALCESILS